MMPGDVSSWVVQKSTIISLHADHYLSVSAPMMAVTFDDCPPEVIAVCYFYFVNPDRFSRSLR
jgi:hypothetical protein